MLAAMWLTSPLYCKLFAGTWICIISAFLMLAGLGLHHMHKQEEEFLRPVQLRDEDKKYWIMHQPAPLESEEVG